MLVPPNTYKRAFTGLNSNRITEFIYGTERLTTKDIREHQLITQFKKVGVCAIFNLQEPHEHPKYNTLTKTGFCYEFSEFENNNIRVHHYPIADFGVPEETNYIFDIVRQMHQYVEQRNSVIVHCQAGVGRTGLILCCYLLFAKHCDSPEAAVLYVSQRRRIRMQIEQEEFVTQFFESHCNYF